MKKIIFLLLILSKTSFSQVQIVKKFDAIDNKFKFMASEPITISDGRGSVKLWPRLYGKEGDLKFEGIIADVGEIFKCSKKDQLIILLDGGFKIKKYSFDILTCNGALFFELDKGDRKDLREFGNMVEIRITNNYSGEVFQSKMPKEFQNYFVAIMGLLDKPAIEIKE